MALVNKEAIVKILRSTLSIQTKKKKLKNYHDGDIADALALLSKEERFKAYELFGVEKTAEIFSYFDNPEDYIEELKADKAADILDELDSDEAINILDELDDEFRSHLISLMEEETRKKVEALDKKDDETIGSYMSDNYITINKEATIKEAMSKLIKEAGEHDNINTLYVVDEQSHLLGAVRLKDLILARKDDSLDKIIISSFPSVLETEIVSEIIQTLKDYSEESIPIVDQENKLLGVISLDNIIEAADEEMTEDYAKLGGLSEIVDVDESPFYSVKKRIPWLIVLLFLGIIVSTVTGTFEHVIAAMSANPTSSGKSFLESNILLKYSKYVCLYTLYNSSTNTKSPFSPLVHAPPPIGAILHDNPNFPSSNPLLSVYIPHSLIAILITL